MERNPGMSARPDATPEDGLIVAAVKKDRSVIALVKGAVVVVRT